MEQAEKTGFDRAQYLIGIVIICAALVLGAAVYQGAGSAKGTVGNLSAALNATNPLQPPNTTQAANATAQANGSAVTGEAQQAAGSQQQAGSAAGNATAHKEVTVDFLYADWCPHCQRMKPVVAAFAAKMPQDRFELRYWNDADRGKADVAAVYDDYSSKGYFQAFPTFVANWEDYRVGEMQAADFAAWVCSKFSAPKPAGC